MPRWLLKCLCLLVSLAMFAGGAVLSSAQDIEQAAEGLRVLSIELQTRSEGRVYDRAPDSATRQAILANLRTRQGLPFSRAEVDRDIDYLVNKSHMFRAVEARAAVDPDPAFAGVRVKLILTQPLVKQLRFIGPPWAPGEVRDRYRFVGSVDTAQGAEFSLPRLDADVKRLFESGAFIDVRGEHKFTAEGVDVVFRVTPNEPLAIVAFSGVHAPGFTTDLQRVIAGREPIRPGTTSDESDNYGAAYFPMAAFSGDVVTDASAANIQGAVELTKEFYRVNGYAFIEVTPRVISLPREYDEATLENTYGTLRPSMLATIRGLISSGYGGRTVLVFEVFEGTQLRVGGIHFLGISDVESPSNDALSIYRISGFFKVIYQFWYGVVSSNADRKAAVLSEVMRLKNGAPYIESDARRDAESLQAYFRQRGWLDATVSFSNFAVNNVRSRVDLYYQVDPGSVYAVSDLRIEYETRAPRVPQGAEPREFDAPVATFAELLEEMDLEGEALSREAAAERYTAAYVDPLHNPAQGRHFGAYDLKTPLPWDEYQIQGSPTGGEGLAGAVRRLLADRGYSNIEVSFERVETEAEFINTDWESPWPVRRVGMILRIQQGYQSIVGNVTFRGNVETRDEVLRRLVTLYPEDVFDRNKLLQSDMRLRRQQWFEQAAPGAGVTSRTSQRLVFSEGEYVEYTDIDYDVVEGRTNRINFAAGFNTATGFTASVDLTLMNFDISSLVSWAWGRPNFSFTGAGQSLSFTAQPPLDRQQAYRINFTEPWLFGYNLYGSISGEYVSQNFIDYTRSRLGVDPTLGWRIFPDVTWFYGYSFSILELTDIAGDAPPEIRRDAGEDVLSTLWSEIVWNTTDNPAFPTAGFNLSYRFSYSGGPLLGGTIDFWRMRANASYYVPVAEIDEVRTLVLAFSATASWQDVHSDTTEIPFVERFLLGGNSIGSRGLLRGFQFAGVGPSRNNLAIGGNFMVQGFTELRFPIFPGSLWAVGFVDAGQLSPTLNTFDPTGWTVSAGVGLRLVLPILPVPFALDFGFPIINQPGNREQVISINLGFGFS